MAGRWHGVTVTGLDDQLELVGGEAKEVMANPAPPRRLERVALVEGPDLVPTDAGGEPPANVRIQVPSPATVPIVENHHAAGGSLPTLAVTSLSIDGSPVVLANDVVEASKHLVSNPCPRVIPSEVDKKVLRDSLSHAFRNGGQREMACLRGNPTAAKAKCLRSIRNECIYTCIYARTRDARRHTNTIMIAKHQLTNKQV